MSRRSRGGFTLLEVLLALTLTAMAAGIAGSTLTAARRTSEVIADHQRHTEADTRLRVLLADMLRHAPDASSVDEPLLSVQRVGASDALTFLSKGVDAPFGTGPIWTVTLRVDGDSLVLDARSASAAVTRHAVVRDVSRLDVRVLAPATALDPAQWRTDWPLAQARPAAIALSWSHGGATESMAPLVVSLDPLSGASTGAER